MDWQSHHAYRAFEEFLQSVVIDRRSYITVGKEALDFAGAFNEIKARFVEALDASDATFDDKAEHQFQGASPNTKRVFANLEYLWGMPAGNISGPKKRSYALRWFADREIVSSRQVFFTGDDCIANPGMWYLTNKYFEMLSICRIFKSLAEDASIKTTKDARDRIEALAFEGIYGKIDLCPNCHYIAHYLLRESDIYKRKADLLLGIRKVSPDRIAGNYRINP